MSDVLARAEIAISANTSAFDKAMEAIPAKAQKQVKKSVDAIKTEMAQVGQAIAQATSSVDTKKLTDYFAKLKTSLDAVKMSAIAQAAALNPAAQAMNAAGKATGFASNKLQVFAQGLDDLQYVPEMGLRPILNNLVQISPALGIAALVLNQFITHWEDLARVVGGGALKTAAQEMEELRKKTDLTAGEFERLARADALKNKGTELRGAKAVGQHNEEAAATTAIVNAGVGNVTQGLLGTPEGKKIIDSQGQAAVVLGKIAKLQDKLKKLEGLKATDTTGSVFAEAGKAEKEIARLKLEELEQARKATAEEKVAQAAIVKELGGRRKEFAEMVRKNPAAFGGGDKEKGLALADALDQADPGTATRTRIAKILKDGISNALQVEIPNKAGEAGHQLTADQKAAGVQLSGGLSGRLTPDLLATIARGGTINRELLQTAIEGGMKRAGVKEPGKFSAEAANSLIGQTRDAVQKRVLEVGGTDGQAAQFLLAQNVNRLKAEAEKNRPSLGVTDIESYHREATDSLLKGGQNAALLDEQKRATDAYIAGKKSLDELTAALKAKKDSGLRLMPP